MDNDNDVIRKGGEALKRILETRTPEHIVAIKRQEDAHATFARALMEYYRCCVECSYHSYVWGRPSNIPDDDALEYLADRASLGAEKVLGDLTDESYLDSLPDSAWWVIDDVIDVLGTIDRKEIVLFWRGTRS